MLIVYNQYLYLKPKYIKDLNKYNYFKLKVQSTFVAQKSLLNTIKHILHFRFFY